MSSRGSVCLANVWLGNCPVQEMSVGELSFREGSVGDLFPRKFHSGIYLDIYADCVYTRNGVVEKCPVGEVSVWQMSGWGIVRSRKCPLGNYPLGKGQSGICSQGNVILGTLQLSNYVPFQAAFTCSKLALKHQNMV